MKVKTPVLSGEKQHCKTATIFCKSMCLSRTVTYGVMSQQYKFMWLELQLGHFTTSDSVRDEVSGLHHNAGLNFTHWEQMELR